MQMTIGRVVPITHTSYPGPFIVARGSKSAPIVDGVLINEQTGELIQVKGFVKMSNDIVLGTLDGKSFIPLPIGEAFFYSADEAKAALIKKYEEAAKLYTEMAAKLKQELDRE